jgi:crotonobetainyl-CoA:carnitine CoA-transferase CaiB-like acyl-CoA transferase
MSSMIGLLSFQAANYFASGELPPRTGNDHGIVAPYGLFETADGQVAIAPSNDAMYEKFLDALELQSLRSHPDFQANADRMLNRESIKAAIEARTRQESSRYWIERLNRYGVPCGQVLNLRDVFDDPQVADQEMAIDVPHPDGQQVRMLGFPIKFAESPCLARAPAPSLGADTEDVLRELGLPESRIQELRAKGAV